MKAIEAVVKLYESKSMGNYTGTSLKLIKGLQLSKQTNVERKTEEDVVMRTWKMELENWVDNER